MMVSLEVKMMRRIGLFVFITILLMACSSQSDVQDIGKTEWTLILLNGASPLEEAKATLNFFDDGLNGTTGCNVYHAGYSISGKTLEVFDLVVTEQDCSEMAGIMEQERVYLDILLNATRLLLEDDQLMLVTKDDQILLFGD
jgi:heat shock protein HslJ